jgi:hypothetical protein
MSAMMLGIFADIHGNEVALRVLTGQHQQTSRA